MRRVPAILETAHVTALGVWAGAVVMSGATAAVIFPQMRELDPTLEAFAATPGEHWVIAAGWVMARVFWVMDAVQLGCAGVAALTLIALVWMRGVFGIRFVLLRVLLVGAAVATLLWYLMAVAQPMSTDLAGYWEAAKAGEAERAATLRASFDARHPVASRALGALGVLALVSAVAGGLSATLTKKGDPA